MGVVEHTKSGFVQAKNKTYAEATAALRNGNIPSSAYTALTLLRSLNLASLTVPQRIELAKVFANKSDYSLVKSDVRREEGILAVLDAPTGRIALARALYQGAPGERPIDSIGKAFTHEAQEAKLAGLMGKELRAARGEWAKTFNSPDPTVRARMGTVAASRDLMHSTFPFNDGPYSSISSTIKDGKISATIESQHGSIALGEPFAVPATNEGVQAELAKRFNQYHYGTQTAPPAFLNALIKDSLNARTKDSLGSGGPPAAVLANAVKLENRNYALTLPADVWSRFLGTPGASPQAIKKEMVGQFSGLFMGKDAAAKLEKSIEIDPKTQTVKVNLMDAVVMVEAKQLNDQAREYFAHDGLDPNFQFVRRVDKQLQFVVPYGLASAFQPLTESHPKSVEEGLETLRQRTNELELGAPSSTPDGLLALSIKDAKRLMAASSFSYAGDAQHDVRNLYGGEQLSALSYLPFDGVMKEGAGFSEVNRTREIEKQKQLKTPPGALADKLHRLGFEIEREIATPLGQALVVRNDTLGIVRVVLRGSDRGRDFFTDILSLEVPFKLNDKTLSAAVGFLRSVESMYPQILEGVQSATAKLKEAGFEDVKLGIDGHSKAGGEGPVLALMLDHDADLNKIPRLQQVNLIEPARAIARWDSFKTGIPTMVGAGIDGFITEAVGAIRDALNWKMSDTTADVYATKLGSKTSVWAMSRDIVPHVGMYGFGRVKPGGILLFDEATGMARSGVEGKPEHWISDPFVEKQKKALFDQGISVQSHMLGNVGPAIFNQIGAGVITD